MVAENYAHVPQTHVDQAHVTQADVAQADVTQEQLSTWAASGLMWLTGIPSIHTGPPSNLMGQLDRLAGSFPGISLPGLLTERAAIAGLMCNGSISCGGACRILATADGWIAVSLPRLDDEALVPAWLGCNPPHGNPWATIEHEVSCKPTAQLVERGVLLQMAVAGLAETSHRPPVISEWVQTVTGHRSQTSVLSKSGIEGAVVIDCSGLWAGPLCGHLLAHQGARVIKVESIHRPDGARFGPPAFFDLMNGTKECVALDFRTSDGRQVLREILMKADIVIDSSRPRAMAQLGVEPTEMIASGGPRIWVSITAHGRSGAAGNRVGFGDDAAVAGGLVVYDGERPMFCGDAIADPLAGIVAAESCLAAISSGFSGILDVAMAATAAACAGPTVPIPNDLVPIKPLARTSHKRAKELGADTAVVLAELGIHR